MAGEEESLTSSSSLTIAEPMPFPLISSFTIKDASSKERSNLRICPMPRISPACGSAERGGQGGSACRPCACRGVETGVGMEGEGGIVCAGRTLVVHTHLLGDDEIYRVEKERVHRLGEHHLRGEAEVTRARRRQSIFNMRQDVVSKTWCFAGYRLSRHVHARVSGISLVHGQHCG